MREKTQSDIRVKQRQRWGEETVGDSRASNTRLGEERLCTYGVLGRKDGFLTYILILSRKCNIDSTISIW